LKQQQHRSSSTGAAVSSRGAAAAVGQRFAEHQEQWLQQQLLQQQQQRCGQVSAVGSLTLEQLQRGAAQAAAVLCKQHVVLHLWSIEGYGISCNPAFMMLCVGSLFQI
jgi:hypothetical protein